MRWSEPEKHCEKNGRVLPISAMSPAFLPDTSCMIAAVCSWHEHHEAAANEIERRLSGRAKMIVAAPALVEAYAVLTRLPPPHRLSPQTALALLENNFLKLATVVALNAKSYETLLLRAPKNNVAGGRAYDAVIGACAQQGEVATVLTFNAADFMALGQDYDVVVPGTS
jgi:predicted nucleic acid-binding protein